MPPGRAKKGDTIKYFDLNIVQYVTTVCWWLMWIYFAKSDSLYVYILAFRESIGGQAAATNLLFGFIAINTGLSLAVLAFSIWAEFSSEYLMKYVFGTLFGGFMVAGPAVKLAVKRRLHLDLEIEEAEKAKKK